MFCCAKRPATAYEVEDVYAQPVQQQPVASEAPAQPKPAVPAQTKVRAMPRAWMRERRFSAHAREL